MHPSITETEFYREIRSYHGTEREAEQARFNASLQYGDAVVLTTIAPPNHDRASWYLLVSVDLERLPAPRRFRRDLLTRELSC